ncbi:DUF2471 family protein [Cupriavidus metallidurans]|uniref:DUF2471 family protein n=1 Tax=Cupriavidus metallidurans TaxID=119219 RepID=UPI001BFCA636|nr:DUF2471 family protein [Cupriavidus metallidurans]QWC91265.1 DUF2471 family protein [Cupriavidus metallidurans]
MQALFAAEAAIREGLPPIIQRHRTVGRLTWRLLHQIEVGIFADLAASGRHSAPVLGMLRSSGLMRYPQDESVVSLAGHRAVPVAFKAILDLWPRLH